MKHIIHRGLPVALVLSVALSGSSVLAQSTTLSVQQIMQQPERWIGAWPANPFWTDQADALYFSWNPEGAFPADSLYRISRDGGEPEKVSAPERRNLAPAFGGWRHGEGRYTSDFSRRVYVRHGDLFLYDLRTNVRTQLTQTPEEVSAPRFLSDDRNIVFRREDNLFRMDLQTGALIQLTDLKQGEAPVEPEMDEQDEFLRSQQEALFEVLRERKQRSAAREAAEKREEKHLARPVPFYTGDKRVHALQADPSARFITFNLEEMPPDAKPTIIHHYVNERGYAADEETRPKVGSPAGRLTFYVQDLHRDTTYQVDLHQVPGSYDVPAYLRERGIPVDSSAARRELIPHGPYWSPDGAFAVMVLLALDNKDRWIVRLHPETGALTVLDRQTDDAWIGGPGIHGRGSPGDVGWLPDNRRFYFQSERTGYSHLYTVDLETETVRQLTDGPFEVFQPQLSRDGAAWFFMSNEGSPHEQHAYRMPVDGGVRTRLSSLSGRSEPVVSPDEQMLGVLYSATTQPPEIYLQPLSPGAASQRITHSTTEEWRSYPWREADIVMVPASDGVEVPALRYLPEHPNGAAVLFVHGAGYLQNVHRWWSQYFREYMFHNLLADLGYVVLDLDYRGSAGYGRDWRTAIYRHMGGRDLQDYVDASRFLTESYGIDPERIAIYGGSYGGFITLMALFTEPAYFGAGAALRSVTDWAHYNHGYTSNILNTPATDSLAFARSSPIYFAEGLKDPLLITHGMVDSNVHFQDVVRLAQRLIELGKEEWELAVYPVEDHGFVEPSSWTDQYRRILRLIERSVGL